MSDLRNVWLLAHKGAQHIVCCGFVLIVFVGCQFLWILHFSLPRRLSLGFIMD